MHRLCLAALVVAVLATPVHAEDEAPALKRYKSTDGNFAVSLPGVPKAQRVPINDPTDKDATQVQYVHGTDDGAYLVSYQDNPKLVEADESIADEALKASQAALAKRFGKLLSEKQIKLDDKYPGRQFEYELEGEKGGLYRSKIFLVDGRLYQVIVVGTREFATSKTADAVFESFGLLEP